MADFIDKVRNEVDSNSTMARVMIENVPGTSEEDCEYITDRLALYPPMHLDAKEDS